MDEEIQGLIPWHIHQANRDFSHHIICDNDIVPADLGQQTKDVLDIRVLEIERNSLAGILLLFRQAGLGHLFRLGFRCLWLCLRG